MWTLFLLGFGFNALGFKGLKLYVSCTWSPGLKANTYRHLSGFFRHRAWLQESWEGKRPGSMKSQKSKDLNCGCRSAPCSWAPRCLMAKSWSCIHWQPWPLWAQYRGSLFSDPFTQRTSRGRGSHLHGLLGRTQHVNSPLCPSLSAVCPCVCVSGRPLFPLHRDWETSWSQGLPQHLWPRGDEREGELRLRYFLVLVFVSGPASSWQKCLSHCPPLRIPSVTSHTPQGCPAPPITDEELGREKQSNSTKALQQHQS